MANTISCSCEYGTCKVPKKRIAKKILRFCILTALVVQWYNGDGMYLWLQFLSNTFRLRWKQTPRGNLHVEEGSQALASPDNGLNIHV